MTIRPGWITGMSDRRMAWLVAGSVAALTPAQAFGQSTEFLYTDTTLLKPSIPEGFDHGRNVSVLEQPRPDYAPLGIRLSSFMLYPKLDAALGATNNVFLSQGGRLSDGFAEITPSLYAKSDWSKHSLTFNGYIDNQDYFSQGRRNQTDWQVGSVGTLEVSDKFSLIGEADGTRQTESPYSGNLQSSLAVLSNYVASYVALRAEYTAGRVRLQLAGDHTTNSFDKIDDGAGVFTDQSYRDRGVTRATGQAEYALSPSMSVYGQAGYDVIDYSHRLPDGSPNRDSKGVRLIGGVNFDLAGFLRGTIGVGYVHRSYDAPIYRSVSGVSVEAKLEYFLDDLTTITVSGRRFLEDSAIASNNPYFDTSATIRVDHAFLTNLLVNMSASYGKTTYQDLADSDREYYRIYGGFTYMISHSVGIHQTIGYGKQTARSNVVGQNFSEVRGLIGVYLQR